MTHTVFCIKLKQEAEGLKKPPFPGAFGQKIYEQVSKKGWNMWLNHQTMLINEYRLNLMEADARAFLNKEMDKFFFGEGVTPVAGFTPEQE